MTEMEKCLRCKSAEVFGVITTESCLSSRSARVLGLISLLRLEMNILSERNQRSLLPRVSPRARHHERRQSRPSRLQNLSQSRNTALYLRHGSPLVFHRGKARIGINSLPCRPAAALPKKSRIRLLPLPTSLCRCGLVIPLHRRLINLANLLLHCQADHRRLQVFTTDAHLQAFTNLVKMVPRSQSRDVPAMTCTLPGRLYQLRDLAPQCLSRSRLLTYLSNRKAQLQL